MANCRTRNGRFVQVSLRPSCVHLVRESDATPAPASRSMYPTVYTYMHITLRSLILVD